MSADSARTRESALREAICEAGRRMKALGFAPGSDGNLSARLEDERSVLPLVRAITAPVLRRLAEGKVT